MRPVLPIGMKPTHYDLRIEPDLENATFEGSVIIEIKVLEWTSSITLNVHELEIRSTTLRDGNGNNLAIASTKSDSKAQTFEILSEGLLHANSLIVLQQIFSGTLRTSGDGFHITPASLSKWPIASTNLEPALARSVFPCFDDPSFKATFSVTIVAPRHLMCLGNMPVKSVIELPGKPHIKRATEFEKSAPMPTYLVAFAIGEFNMVENNDFRIPIKAYAPQDFNIENCRYALDIAARALGIHEKTFHIECGLAKLDLVVIPGSDGGMENWGLITVATGVLVIGPDNSASEKALSATVIAHELAHQWFGNLVTMKNWGNFWVKEALSEWADANAREQISGEKPWEEFVADGMQSALEFDGSRFSHAVGPSCGGVKNSPYYDRITYQKGCALMRMLENRLGKDVFLNGVRRYLKRYTYKTTQVEDLWEALSLSSGLDIGDMMKDWTHKVGYPVVSVEEDHKSGTIIVSQQRFLINGNNHTKADDTLYSPIFLEIWTSRGILKDFLEEKSKTIKVPLASSYKLNTNQTSFFRVAYPSTHLLKLAENIFNKVPSPIDRISLISDLAALSFACHPTTHTSTLLTFLLSFQSEPNFFVWKTIISVLQTLRKNLLFEEKGLNEAFGCFWKELVNKCLYAKGTFKKEDDLNETRFKAMMFGNSGGDRKVREAAWEMWKKFVGGKGDKKAIHPDIRAEVFEIVIREGGKQEFNKLLSLLPTTINSLRKDILASLGYSQTSSCIKKTINLAFSPTCLSNKETSLVLQSLTTHKTSLVKLYKFVALGKWKKFPGMNPDKLAPVGALLLDSLTKKEMMTNARKYLKRVDVEEFSNEIEMSFEAIEARSAWLERDKEEVVLWLKNNGFWKHKEKRGTKRCLIC